MLDRNVQALKQALQQLGGKEYKVIRKATRGFNEKGRPEKVETEVKVFASILPAGAVQVNDDGNGKKMTASFNIVVVEPDYICADDIFETKEYGRLRIQSLQDTRYLGSMSATAVRETLVGRYLRSGEDV